MVGTYFVIFIVAVVLTLPLASTQVTYAYNAEVQPDYDALYGVSKPTRLMVYLMMGVLMVMMVLLCVNKSETIADRAMYEQMYNMGSSRFNRRGVEPTFGIITIISPSFVIFLLIYAVLSVGFHLLGIVKSSPNIWLSMFCYLTLDFVLHDMIQIRAAVAAGLCLFAIRFIAERRWWFYFPIVIAAVFFHYSAIVFVPMYFLPTKRINKYFWVSVVVISFGMGLAGLSIGSMMKFIPLEFINKFFTAYMGNKQFVAAGIGPRRFMMCFMLIVMIIRSDEIRKYYPLAMPCLLLSIFSQMSYLLFADIPVMQGRLGEFFGLADIFTLAMFPMVWRKAYYAMFIPPIALMIYNLTTCYGLLTTPAI